MYLFIDTLSHLHTDTHIHTYQHYLTVYKTHVCTRHTPISAGQIKKKKLSTISKHDETNIMNIINYNTFNLHYNSLLNNYNRYMEVIRKAKLRVAR